MRCFSLILYCCFILLPSFHRVLCLRCRTGNQQSDDQLQKIMQVCRRRYLGYDRDSGRDYYNGRNSDSDESSSSDSDSNSDEDMFDNKFLTGGNFNRGYNRNMGNSRVGSSTHQNRNWRSSSSGRSGSYSMNNMNNNSRSSYGSGGGDYAQMNSNRKNMRNNGGGMSNGYDNNYSSNRNSHNNNMNRNYNNNNYDDNNNNNQGDRERACVIQCFFSELNLVDQRGFPERSSVIGIMTQNIQDPELRDFVEESVIECYHYLNNNGRQEKCRFSQNLLSCLAEKGNERCEDWNDD